jgi:hypothetical protein
MSQQHADRDVRRLSDRLQVLPQSLRATIVVYSREARKELAAGAQEAAEGRHVVALRDLEEYGRRLFALLVEADERGDELVIAELPPPEGIGRAVRDRLLRAADRGETPDGGRGTSPGGR